MVWQENYTTAWLWDVSACRNVHTVTGVFAQSQVLSARGIAIGCSKKGNVRACLQL